MVAKRDGKLVGECYMTDPNTPNDLSKAASLPWEHAEATDRSAVFALTGPDNTTVRMRLELTSDLSGATATALCMPIIDGIDPAELEPLKLTLKRRDWPTIESYEQGRSEALAGAAKGPLRTYSGESNDDSSLGWMGKDGSRVKLDLRVKGQVAVGGMVTVLLSDGTPIQTIEIPELNEFFSYFKFECAYSGTTHRLRFSADRYGNEVHGRLYDDCHPEHVDRLSLFFVLRP